MIPKRQIAIGDIHGCYELTRELVERVIRFDPASDQLIFMGDYIDRGKDSYKVVVYVDELSTSYPESIILLAGNHEYLAFNAIKHRTYEYMQLWFINGGIQTIKSFGNTEDNDGNYERAEEILVPFIEKLRFYYETEEYIFVHGGIPEGKTVEIASDKSLLWERNFETYRGKHVIVGHTPHKTVTKYPHATVVDTGAVFYGKLSGLDVINDVVYETQGSHQDVKLEDMDGDYEAMPERSKGSFFVD